MRSPIILSLSWKISMVISMSRALVYVTVHTRTILQRVLRLI